MGWNDHVDKNAAKRKDKRARRERPQEAVDARELNGDVLIELLATSIALGGCIRIGATRDGGAWAFGVYGDTEEPYTEYVRPSEDVNRYMAELALHLRNGVQ